MASTSMVSPSGAELIDPEHFCYLYNTDLDDVNFRIKVGTLEGDRTLPNYKELVENALLKFSGLYVSDKADLKVTVQLFSHGKAICTTKQTPYKSFSNFWNWNEWLSFPIKFSDLPRDSTLAFTIWDSYGPDQMRPVGCTTLSLFGKYGCMRRGIYDLRIWPEQEATLDSQSCPGKSAKSEEVARISKLMKKYNNGQMQKIEWLDRLTFPAVEQLREGEKKKSKGLYLSIEFPKIVIDNVEHSVVYFENEANDNCQLSFESGIVAIPDPEILNDNLVESKHHKLSRNVRSGLSDRDLKPNPQIRDQLATIVNSPSTKILSSEEQDLVWKFRFYLINQKKALTKFLKCLNWEQQTEVKQAVELLQDWQPMDIEDALELLSPHFQHQAVRRYAVSRLQQAPDEDLQLYLLQLVQALKYEDFDEIRADFVPAIIPSRRESVASAATAEAAMTDEKRNSIVSHATTTSSENNDTAVNFPESDAGPSSGTSADKTVNVEEQCDLATFLINRAAANETLANYFYWYLTVEYEEQKQIEAVSEINRDNRVAEMYTTVMERFSHKLQKGSKAMQMRAHTLNRQKAFVNKLVDLMRQVAREKGDRLKKIEKLQSLLASTESFNFGGFDPLPLPLDPSVKIKSILAQKATLFKSALMPSRLTFLTVEEQEYVAIMKYGDDLRQDQLILQIITLMDKLLRRENLDLKLTPYNVLASSSKHGFVQYIESVSVADVLKSYESIQKFFRSHSPSDGAPHGITTEVMDAYVKSCAGYCIITYLLGVGDRHFDNLLLTKNGNLFHIDFGYILGYDPKPFPPPMKLSREMVEGMGGVQSEYYQQFRKLCYTAFLHLRRHANLILNLFTLMVGATIPAIAMEPDKTVKKVQDKFRLDLNDEEAVKYMQQLIDESVTGVMSVIVEQFHKFAQYWRK